MARFVIMVRTYSGYNTNDLNVASINNLLTDQCDFLRGTLYQQVT